MICRDARSAVRLGSSLLVFVLMGACQRKAPSPEECLEFAMRGLHIDDERLLAVPDVKDKVDAVVVKCLTTPYDKELIGCVKLRPTARSCMLEFDERERRRNRPVDR